MVQPERTGFPVGTIDEEELQNTILYVHKFGIMKSKAEASDVCEQGRVHSDR